MTKNLIQDEMGRTITLSSKIFSKTANLSDNIETITGLATLLQTSLGPNGLDKILQSPNDDLVITNDGATILQSMEMTTNPISRLFQRLSSAVDDEIGDGTTTVVLFASALLKEAESLIKIGIHPIKISNGFDIATKLILSFLDKIKEENKPSREILRAAAITSLNSKIVSKDKDLFADICVNAITKIQDSRKDVDFELIKIVKKIGQSFSQSELIDGVLLDKSLSHPQMEELLQKNSIEPRKIALLACPFEPPKLKTNHVLNISSVEDYKSLESYEKEKFIEMIRSLKNAGANFVFCQWGFDDEANGLLLEHELPAIRWIGGQDMELAAVYTKGNIISRFEELTNQDLGTGIIEEIKLGTENEKSIKLTKTILSEKSNTTVTILLRGSSNLALDEAERSLRDALCSVRNTLQNSSLIYGGGSFEIAAYNHLQQIISDCKNTNQISVDLFSTESKPLDIDGISPETFVILNAYSQALLQIPLILSKNANFPPIESVDFLISEQLRQKSYFLGIPSQLPQDMSKVAIEAHLKSYGNMRKNRVFDSSSSKSNSMAMATQLVNMILKIDEVVYVEGNE
ncbi:T-complex protein 1, epsilon subunit [Pseudoloma neurophilia]|uniref:T-complex protein 1, epsilon subunit n=1 Tax=Pseudoloma neurophilia TaxID=146866 RepID=A0A0R0M1E2_9MICR|nr:T-complex protein 1, epsilon subunit [Pseudoloma neurophilia]